MSAERERFSLNAMSGAGARSAGTRSSSPNTAGTAGPVSPTTLRPLSSLTR